MLTVVQPDSQKSGTTEAKETVEGKGDNVLKHAMPNSEKTGPQAAADQTSSSHNDVSLLYILRT